QSKDGPRCWACRPRIIALAGSHQFKNWPLGQTSSAAVQISAFKADMQFYMSAFGPNRTSALVGVPRDSQREFYTVFIRPPQGLRRKALPAENNQSGAMNKEIVSGAITSSAANIKRVQSPLPELCACAPEEALARLQASRSGLTEEQVQARRQ